MPGRLSTHFVLKEFVPASAKLKDVPHPVAANIALLVNDIMEPARSAIGVPLIVHDGWRPAEHNAAVGGVAASDHLAGRACDFHAAESIGATWEDNTFVTFHWIMDHLAGRFGQLILEDHRAHYVLPTKLWIHVSLPSKKHPGTEADPSRLLVSSEPKHYEPWTEGRFA